MCTSDLQYQPIFYPTAGYTNAREQTRHLVIAAYYCAYTALWNAAQLSQAEKDAAFEAVRGFIINSENPEKAYAQLVQRVLMARFYSLSNEGVTIPEPSAWFNAGNANGFPGTANWYDRLHKKRQAYPLHRLELKAFPEAILEMVEDASARNFHYWRSWFIGHDNNKLLNLFLSTVANLSFR